MISKTLNWLSLFFIGTGLYHLVGVFYHINEDPTWRHLLFAILAIPTFYLMRQRPPYFTYLFALILVQQWNGHGRYLLRMWQEKNSIHWISVLDLSVLTLIFILLILERKQKVTLKFD